MVATHGIVAVDRPFPMQTDFPSLPNPPFNFMPSWGWARADDFNSPRRLNGPFIYIVLPVLIF